MYFTCIKETHAYYMKFSATFANIDQVCRLIDEFLNKHRLMAFAFVVKLGTREILNNAVQHGSQNDSDKHIQFTISLDLDLLCLMARDEGDGFAPLVSSSKTNEILAESGRGLDILEKYFDYVTFSAAGNEINLELNVAGESA